MSYQDINPPFYEMFEPGTPYHAGARGWTQAPFPGWGNNPVLRGPKRLGVQGLGAHDLPELSLQPHYAPLPTNGLGCGCSGAGASGVGQDQSAKLTMVLGLGITAALLTLGYFALRPRYARNRRRRYRRNARWSTQYKDRLQDSDFLYVDKDCVSYREKGRSHPLSCRKFPYRNHTGNVDLPHLRNAIARIPVSNIPARDKDRLQNKARRILARETGRKAA